MRRNFSDRAIHQKEKIFPPNAREPTIQGCDEEWREVLRKLSLRDVKYQKGVERQAYCDMCLHLSVVRDRFVVLDSIDLTRGLSIVSIISVQLAQNTLHALCAGKEQIGCTFMKHGRRSCRSKALTILD